MGRFAPTPSGRMHLGNAFSALMAWASARSCGGRMVLRIEDLDPRAQSRKDSDQLMLDLLWLGLDWDEGPFYQSERRDVYDAAVDRLCDKGLLYPCFCSRSELHAACAPHASDGSYVYAGTCRDLSREEVAAKSRARKPALRLRVPRPQDEGDLVRFEDLGYGWRQESLSGECGDFLVRRSDGVIAYQLAVVVDDALMGVTQVVRGRDLLGSVGRQRYLAWLLGFEPPCCGHVPLLVAADGRRLSKRDNDLDLGALRERGVRPEQVVGLLASKLGLAAEGEEISAQELAARFGWDAVRAHRADIVVGDGPCPWRSCPDVRNSPRASRPDHETNNLS